MQCEQSSTLGRSGEGHAPALRLHHALYKVKAQSVARNVRANANTTIKRFEQMPPVDAIDSGAVVTDAKLNFPRGGIVFCKDFDVRRTAAPAVFECIAEQVLKALCERSGIGLHRGQFRID